MVNLKFELKNIFSLKNILAVFILGLVVASLNFSSIYLDKDMAYMERSAYLDEFTSFLLDMKDKGIETETIDRMLKSSNEFNMHKSDHDKKGMVKDLISFYTDLEFIGARPSFETVNLPINLENIRINKGFLQELESRDLGLEDEEYSLSGFNHVKSLLGRLQSPYLFLGVLFVILYSLLGDFKGGGYGLRKTQPGSGSSYYLAKILAGEAFFVFSLILFLSLSFLLCLAFGDGLGSFSYPVAIGPVYKDIVIVDFSKDIYYYYLTSHLAYIIKAISYYSLYALASFSILMPIVLIFKDELTSFFILATGLLINHNILFKQRSINHIGVYFDRPRLNPFAYEAMESMIYDIKLNPLFALELNIIFLIALIAIASFMAKLTFVQNFNIKTKVKDIRESLGSYEKKSSSFSPVLSFEFKKLFARRDLYVFLIVFVLITSYFVNAENEAYIKSYRGLYQDLLDDYEEARKSYESKNYWYYTGEVARLANNLGKAIKNFVEKGEAGIKDAMLAHMEWQNLVILNSLYDSSTPAQAKIQVELLKKLEKSDFSYPIYSLHIQKTTPFDQKTSYINGVLKEKYSEFYHRSQAFILNKILEKKGSLVLIISIAFVAATGISLERGDARNIDFMNTSFVSSKKLVRSKLFAQSLIGVGMVLLFLLIAHLNMIMLTMPMDYNYPVSHYTNGKDENSNLHLPRQALTDGGKAKVTKTNQIISVDYKSVGRENIEIIGMTMASLILIISLAFLVSLYLKNRYLTVLVPLIIMMLGYFLGDYLLKAIDFTLPFIWLNPTKITRGIENVIYDREVYVSWLGILVSLIWTGVFYVLSSLGYKKVFRR